MDPVVVSGKLGVTRRVGKVLFFNQADYFVKTFHHFSSKWGHFFIEFFVKFLIELLIEFLIELFVEHALNYQFDLSLGRKNL